MRSSLLLALCSATLSYAIPTVEAVGGKFFTSDGDQFFIKGVAYQLTESKFKPRNTRNSVKQIVL